MRPFLDWDLILLQSLLKFAKGGFWFSTRNVFHLPLYGKHINMMKIQVLLIEFHLASQAINESSR